MMFILLLLIHVIGDFYLQPKKMSNNKSKNFWCLVSHALIIGLTYMILSSVIIGDYIISVSLILIGSHFAIDFFTSGFFFRLIKKEHLIKYVKSIWSYCIDQLLHIVVLIFISLNLIGKYDLSNLVIAIAGIGFEVNWLILLVLFALLIYKPTNYFIEKVLIYSGVGEIAASDQKSIIIGYAERTIYFVAIVANAPLIISFVIGMKTWAQTEKLRDKGKPFVSTFLIGSLTSLAVTMILGYVFIELIEFF